MRLILANPHVHYYGKNVRNFLLRNHTVIKYSFVIDQYLRDNDKPVAVFLDGTRSSFNELGIRFRYFPRFFVFLEYLAWSLINGLNPVRHKVYFNIDKLNPTNDVILNFSFTTLDLFTRNNERTRLSEYQGLVFTHLTHYLRNTKQIAERVAKIPHNVLVAENDLGNNKYFQNFFRKDQKVYQLPFAYEDRFINKTSFSQRINKCFAIGAFSSLGLEYEKFFGKNPCLHPMRKIIHENRSRILSQIDSFLADYDGQRRLSEIKPGDSFRLKFLKRYLPYFLLNKIISDNFKDYYKFDIVAKYNEYRMYISPEEIFGLPSVCAFEGMACGAALIAVDDPMYTNLGLKPKVHYITYKQNDLNGLIATIDYYQHHPKELELIAQRGCDFTRKHFSKKSVAKTFWKDLDYFCTEFQKENFTFRSSFQL